MIRLAMVLFSIVATTLMGVAIIAALVTGYDTLRPILTAAAIGLVLAVPATWVVARKVAELR